MSWSCGHIAAMVAGSGVVPWLFSGYYGNPDQSKRYISWELLRRIGRMTDSPWLCLGDFNEICCNAEKVGGNLKSQATMERFRRVIDEHHLIDFGNLKREITWYGRGVMERLDQALCNREWLGQFPRAAVKVLDWLCSDHRPLLVSFMARESKRKCGWVNRNTRFHFKEAWCEDVQCGG